ncbi:MAG TPA: hypothetical protein VGW38_28310 [Chloroflexota bacterium]|nr:hypothetical protein [Chloroflexota bacterium]
MPNEFTVVGENRNDETELLVLGTDGQYYEYDPAREHFTRTEPNEEWELFAPLEELEAQSP